MNFYRKVLLALKKLIKSEKSTEDPSWLCCLPLFHFLNKNCQPYEDINLRKDHNARKPLWWGKEDIEEEMEYLKGKTKWSM